MKTEKRRLIILEQICTQLNAIAVQHIGKILVIYQAQEDEPVKNLPSEKTHHSVKNN